MDSNKKIDLIFIFSILAVVFSFFGTCSSCAVGKRVNKAEISIKSSVDSVVLKTYSKEELNLMLEIQGLKDERRSVLNINQIFLTQKRPDQRVIEIDNEIAKKEDQLKTLKR